MISSPGSRHIYPNMDILRYALAFAVVIAHVDYLTGYHIPFPISSYEGVGGFFALSGFLMYPSFMKHRKSGKYIKSRAKRLLPQYLAIVFLCAFGFFFISSFTASQYFSSGSFWKYLIANVCFLNWIEPDLPGVFDGTQFASNAVNGSLWSMKVEWCLYFSVPIFVWILSKIRIKATTMAVAIIIFSICYRLVFQHICINTENEIYNILGRQIFGQFSYFYCGMLIYFFLDWFKRHLTIILISSSLCLLIPVNNLYYETIASPLYLSAFVMAVSLWPKDISCLRHNNNISYNIYLYHWPVIQLCVWSGIAKQGAFATFSAAIILTVVLSIVIEILLKHLTVSRQKAADVNPPDDITN